MNKLRLFCSAMLLASLSTLGQKVVHVSLTGLQDGDEAMFTISSTEYLSSLTVNSDGEYIFEDVEAGKHCVSVSATGYTVSSALNVVVADNGTVTPAATLRFAITKDEDTENFHFVWSEDGTVAGMTTTDNVNDPIVVEFLGKQIVPADVPSQHNLLSYFQIILSDEEESWTEEYAYRLWQTMQTFEIASQDNEPGYKSDRAHNKFVLTDELLADDLEVTDAGDGNKIVRVSKAAFVYANPYFVSIEGIKGRYFSKRLHHAMTNYVTDYGSNVDVANEILSKRFGCTIQNIDYEEVTAGITDEGEGSFQMFKASEIVSIINMFEELPEGYHVTDHLKYLLRRRDTHPHPIYPDAAAVSWPVDNGYIEFMERAFGGNNEQFDTQRLILHEKTHFLWAFTFNEQIKQRWIELGQWYQDPNAPSGWLTHDQTGFVSEYAHNINPDEDMAESVAYYMKDPEWLRSRNLEKYEFIRDYIMHGSIYISTIPDHLTFEVLNLWPDYDYPGKITKIEVVSEGKPDEDKTVTIDLWINHVEGCEDGAASGWTRIFSPEFLDQHSAKQTHCLDVGFSPVDGNLFHLRAEVVVGKNLKSGDWSAYNISLSDEQGNARFSSSNADYVWRLQINNSYEDLWVPEYEPYSLTYELYDGKDSEGHDIQVLHPMFKAYDDRIITHSYLGIGIENSSHYSWASYGGLMNPDEINGGWIDSKLEIPPYFPSGNYFVGSIAAYDKAGNGCWVLFPDHYPIIYQEIVTPDPDYTAPEIDLNRIAVYAEPTNPEAPNGETKVSISFFIRDDKAGASGGDITLRDPQGGQHSFGYSVPSGHTYWDGNTTEWVYINANCTLAPGSAPGIWGVAEISTTDHALNSRTFNFVETMIFEPDDDESNYILFADLDENNVLTLDLTDESDNIFGVEYRVIHEETGSEITSSTGNSYTARSSATNQVSMNVSSLPDGNLIVIANVYDMDGVPVTSRSCRVVKATTSSVQSVIADGLNIHVEGRVVTIVSDILTEVNVTTLDGRYMRHTIYKGVNTFTLPAAGFYIIGNHKFAVN